MRVLIALLTGIILTVPAIGDTLKIATAANFKSTLVEIGKGFEASTGHTLLISGAATGVLYNQILRGAPFDILLAADTAKPQLLEQQGYTVAGSRFTYAYGQLVLAYRESLTSFAKQGIGAVLQSPDLDLVIANPGHAPYGQAAGAVLANYTLANGTRLLRAANVSQAYQMWFSGGADAALVGLSFNPVHYLTIDTEDYPPLQQQAVLLKIAAAKPAATDFMHYLQSSPVRRLIEARGYATTVANHD